MSSNELHITRANYEAYFLLYVDGELTPAQSDAVEAFAALHPDLQEELDLLLTTRLNAETVCFSKESLMADSMKQNVIDESLLLYIDDELKGEAKKNLEEKIASDATYQYQLNLLQQTKLPAEAISYPNKAELYRKSERRVRPIIWYRAAAAVFVLMASGYMWYLNQTTVPPTTSVATAPITKPVPAQPSGPVTTTGTTTIDIAAIDQTTDPATVATPAEDRTETVVSSRYTAPVIAQHTANTNQADAIRIDIPVTRNNSIDAPVVAADGPQQIINTQDVTAAPLTAYIKKNPEVNTDESGDQAVALENENHKRGSVKGFLRKATRFIERRTGVATTNEDDELLIGAVAIKLK